MKLISLKWFAEKYFSEGSRPSIGTLRRWANNGALPGKRIADGHFYVDEDKLDESQNPLVKKVLDGKSQ